VGAAGPILRGPEPGLKFSGWATSWPGLKSLQASGDKLCFGSGQARPAWPMVIAENGGGQTKNKAKHEQGLKFYNIITQIYI
jgi:hypothetical protein